ncbi:PilW family protein [Undibacterium sp. Ren11W]|uniref:PilW family protein n=1 Tax=Undibacterium sp. Ren11W TaxID=3413045 RepID=UPI003BF41A0C
MNNNYLPHFGFSRHQGFTLIELMVSITIGLIILLFITSLFVNSKASYDIGDDSSRLQEDGRYAMGVIGRNIIQAGYGKLLTATTTDFVKADGSPAQAMKGCNSGFADPKATSLDPVCGTSGKPAFQIRYRVDDTYNANTGVGADCNGQNAAMKNADGSANTTATDPGIVTNRFYLATKSGESTTSLYCNGSGAFTNPQPILSNVEDMLITYGADTSGNFTPDQYTTDATVIEALPISPNNNKTNWNQIISVKVCLQVVSANKVTTSAQTYTKCDGSSATASDKKLRATFTNVFTIRNNSTPSLK